MDKVDKEKKGEKIEEPKKDKTKEEEVLECDKLNKEYLEGWKRERANFLNYKKEEVERMGELIKYANEEIILRILPILDNFFIAEKNIPEDMQKDKHAIGLLQIHQQLKDFLKSQGVEEIKAVGEKFDPNFHEVVGETEANDKEQGIIIEETQRGYTLFGRIIRPAKVKVTK